jgi:hypothetical protein
MTLLYNLYKTTSGGGKKKLVGGESSGGPIFAFIGFFIVGLILLIVFMPI